MDASIQTCVRSLRRVPLLLALLSVGVDTPVAAATNATDRFYDPEVVQKIHLEINPEDLGRMHQALPRRIYVPGSFRWNDETLSNVGVRFKGDSSSMPDSPFKRGFLIDFSEFQKQQRFLGLRQVALDNGIQFGSVFSERLITDVLRGVGVKASRCNYARLYLNGKYQGVYVNVERIDRVFLQRNFGNDGGALFKVDQAGPGADLGYLGSDPALYREASNCKAALRSRHTKSCSNLSAPSTSLAAERKLCAGVWTSRRCENDGGHAVRRRFRPIHRLATAQLLFVS